MMGQQIFWTRFSYFRLSRKCGNIHLTYEYLKTVLIRNCKWSERRDPYNISCFLTQEWCALDFAEIALKGAYQKYFSNISTKTYVVGTLNNHLNEMGF